MAGAEPRRRKEGRGTRSRWWSRLPARGRLAAAAALLAALLGLAWLALPDARALAARAPATTALIEQRRAEARQERRPYSPRQVWVPLERISPRLVAAVIASEDASFWSHHGFDWGSLREAAREGLARRKLGRGGSTITQQLAKNLWLGTERSLWRKGREAVLAAWLEARLPKRRILALYLNVAEWGNGLFGADAGARAHLGVGAGALTTAQAVLLASMLPAPRRVDLRQPSGWLRFRATHLLDRLRDEGAIGADEHRSASTELARLLAGPTPPGEREEVPEEEATADEPPPPQGAGTAGQADSAPPEQPARPQE